MRTVPKNSLIRGSIDKVHGDILHGWIFGAMSEARPLILVDNEPAKLLDSCVDRPDVCAAFGVGGDLKPGFAFRLPPAKKGARVELFGVTAESVYLVAESELQYPIIETNFYAQLERSAKVARLGGSVGIACWDGAHNPVGRAKTLYDISATQRPTVLVCYLHREFGGRIWPPLTNWNGNIVAIPWSRRNEGHELLARYGINFDTVWISKPRVPSFMLAAAISRPDTRFVLDIDDFEDAFYLREDLASACYDLPGKNLAHFLLEQVSARTVSGPALKEKFRGEIVRHARQPMDICKNNGGDCKRIVFCGTARPHKNVAAIAKALNMLAAGENLKLNFHVYGDIQPPELRKELEEAGAIIHGITYIAEMPKILAEADVLISGYFSDADETCKVVAKYQVPAKISDALAAGKPILIPESEATADLAEIPGLYVFNKTNLLEKLLAALKYKKLIYMPADFTPTGAYPAFAAVEKKAQKQQLNGVASPGALNKAAPPTLVLLWKQQDAGFYGRRIDQIARSYKREYPEYKVIILELMHKSEECWLMEDETENYDFAKRLSECEVFYDEKYALSRLREQKKYGLLKENIIYQLLQWNSAQGLRKELSEFLYRQELNPNNTLFIIFPIVEKFEEIEDLLRPFKKVIDVVDNELGWSKNNVRRARLLDQYFRLTGNVIKVVFSTKSNLDFFINRHIVHERQTCVIPNWYVLPKGIKLKQQPISDSKKHVIYSGNMNDRIDWKVLETTAGLENIKLHLVGTAGLSDKRLKAVVEKGAIYHGVLAENELLELCSTMDAAIVPHIRNHISEYMDPIKVIMYETVGLQIMCPKWLNVPSDNIILYEDVNEAVMNLKLFAKRNNEKKFGYKARMESADKYIELLSNSFKFVFKIT